MSANTSSQELIKTREQLREEHEENNQQEKPSSKRLGRVRMIPIWLRLIIVIALIFVSLTAGAVIGYSVIGNGKAGDTFKKDTWTHIIDLVDKE
ncbi:DNA-directed RNA polymerase subunit beta [Niallia taxi]|nr:DNA-directed RNA polymerase subunit beta [Niallia taxi]MDE5053812.1 DNA-directed RNA polymerase subunit beta [Niallia taxi]